MSKASGVITDSKSFTGKFGPMWNMTVNGTRYGTGKASGGNVGDFVEFDVEQKGEFFNAKNIVNKGPPRTEVSAPASNAPRPKADMSKEDWARKDDTVTFLSSRNAANTLLIAALNKDLIPAPGKTKNWIDVLEAMSDELTLRFFNSSKNLGAKTSKLAAQPVDEGDFKDDEIAF